MKQDCKFKEQCGGGHSTAQHYLHVYDRFLPREAYYAIKEELDRLTELEEEAA